MNKNCIEPEIFTNFDTRAHEFFNEMGFVVLKLDIDIQILKKAREMILDFAYIEEESGDSCFYENRNYEEGNVQSPMKRLQRIWNILNKDKLFHHFPLSKVHKDGLNKIFYRKTNHNLYTISSYQANILYPGAPQQKIHLDTPVPEPLPIWPIKVTTVNLLDDFTEDNGATLVAPKSHKFLKRIAVLGSYAASYAREIAYEENHIQVRNNSIQFENDLAEMLGYNCKPKLGSCKFN